MSFEFISFSIKSISGTQDTFADLALNRPDVANAFNAKVIDELVDALEQASQVENLRFLLLSGKGKHFSAGADLEWMKSSANLSKEENIKDANKLIKLMENFDRFPLPTITVTKGAVYGGAVGLVACSDIAIATDSAKFCLSEVKLGLLPAVILPYLTRKIRYGQLRRLGLTAKVFDAQEALEYGLVQNVCSQDQLNATIQSEVKNILSCSPKAQKELKELQHYILTDSTRQSERTAQTIANMRVSKEAQAGLGAFFSKKAMPWHISLAEKEGMIDVES